MLGHPMGDNMNLNESLGVVAHDHNIEADDDHSNASHDAGSSPSSGGRSNSKKHRRPGAESQIKQYYPKAVLEQMRANPNTPVVFQPELTLQKILKEYVKPKKLGSEVRTKEAAQAYLAAQSLSFNTAFSYYQDKMELYHKRRESRCVYHAWRKAERGHSLGRKRKLLQAAAKKRGDLSIIPHPAGEDRVSPRLWH
jgi:hypothetical protein